MFYERLEERINKIKYRIKLLILKYHISRLLKVLVWLIKNFKVDNITGVTDDTYCISYLANCISRMCNGFFEIQLVNELGVIEISKDKINTILYLKEELKSYKRSLTKIDEL